jgi:hypothetical protein
MFLLRGLNSSIESFNGESLWNSENEGICRIFVEDL